MPHKTSKLLFILGIAYIVFFFGVALGAVGNVPDPKPFTRIDAVVVALVLVVPFVLGYYGRVRQSE